MNILLIEDDPGIGRFVSRGLTAEGYVVEWLQAGRTAPERLRTNGFDAAILDIGLPDIDGMELCSALRRDGIETPVLMLTARDALEDKLDGFRCGADDYLAKPFAFEELLARLNVLARRGARRGEGLAAGDLHLDLGRRSARVGDEPLQLSRREFEVLAALARRPGVAQTRQEILDEAWGPGADVAENTVDVYVGYLRRRLAAAPGAPRIESVRTIGFRLVLSS